MIDLVSEYWSAVASVRVEHYRRLEALGCSRGALACLAPRTGPFGVATVRVPPHGGYEPDEGGAPAMIMPVMADDGGFFTPEPYDLIAFRTNRPRRWWWRIGHAAALGEDLIDCCDVLPVVETPLDWLSGAGECLCILDWNAPPPFWARLRNGPRLVLQSEELRRRICLSLSRLTSLPDMEVGHAA